MVPCPSLSSPDEPSTPMNPLQGSGVSDRSRCGAVRILELADEPSTRDRACRRLLSLWCRANPELAGEPSGGDRACRIARRRTLCGDRCGAVRILELADEPSAGSGVSERSRCGAVRILELAGEPSAGIGRVGSLAGEPSAWDRVVPCESLSSPMNPLRGSGVSERSRCGACESLSSPANPLRGSACRIARRRTLCGDRCGAVRILELADEPSAGIGRVGALSLWCRANP